jgi:hypothetical protein
MQQRDSLVNLEVARDSRRIAQASKRDSSAMKTIALLTMVFLPPTFVAVSAFAVVTFSAIAKLFLMIFLQRHFSQCHSSPGQIQLSSLAASGSTGR